MSTAIGPIFYHFLQARLRWHTLRGPTLQWYQYKRAQRIIAYAQEHSPFYRLHWNAHNLQNWQTLPTVDKRIMMSNFSTFNTRGITLEKAMQVALQAEESRDFTPRLNDVTVGLSSGTSGHRGLFLASDWEQAAWAGTILARTLHKIPVKSLRVAFFLRSNSNLYEQVGSGLIHFRYFDLMLPLPQAVAQLNAFQPQIVIGPPSLLCFLAQEQRDDRLKITPDRLISVAEVLEAHDRSFVNEIFQAPVHQIYQCTEGLLATSCAYGSLHIQEDIVYLQFEALSDHIERLQPDQDPSVQAPGGRVMPIVTDLWRQTQPIIRYRLNDILHLAASPCPCGSAFRVIEMIEGRSDAMCYFKTLEGKNRAIYPDTLRRMILLATPDIEDYQIYQEGYGQMRVHVQIAAGVDKEMIKTCVLTSIASTLAGYNCQNAKVQLEFGLEPPVPGKKRRRVQRLCEAPCDYQ